MYIDFSSGKVSLVLVKTDMRSGFDRLAGIASQYLGIDVMKGEDWVVFISKSGHMVKIIHADEKGALLISRKLHQGRFQTLMTKITGPAVKTLSKEELERYLDGDEIEVKRTGFLKG